MKQDISLLTFTKRLAVVTTIFGGALILCDHIPGIDSTNDISIHGTGWLVFFLVGFAAYLLHSYLKGVVAGILEYSRIQVGGIWAKAYNLVATWLIPGLVMITVHSIAPNLITYKSTIGILGFCLFIGAASSIASFVADRIQDKD